MPLEYRAIPEAARVTRADLAALLAVRVPALRARRGRASRAWPSTSRGRGPATRWRACSRSGSWTSIRTTPSSRAPSCGGSTWRARRRARSTCCTGRAARRRRRPTCRARTWTSPSSSACWRPGLMGLTPTGAFEPWRPVSGREAIDVVDAVARLWVRAARVPAKSVTIRGRGRRHGREGAAAQRTALLRALRRRHREPGSPGGAPQLPEGHGGLLRERGRRLLLHDRGGPHQGHDPRRRRPRDHPEHAGAGRLLRRDGAARQRAALGHRDRGRGERAARRCTAPTSRA